MLVVGLTGGIGAGKSTAAARFAELGAAVIDVDAIGRNVLAPGGRAEQGVIDAFGPGITDGHGHIDRAKVAAEVFGRPDRLAALEAVSHPAINAELDMQLQEMGEGGEVRVAVLDMAVLTESRSRSTGVRAGLHPEWWWWKHLRRCACPGFLSGALPRSRPGPAMASQASDAQTPGHSRPCHRERRHARGIGRCRRSSLG